MNKFLLALPLMLLPFTAIAEEPTTGFSQFFCHDPDAVGGLAIIVDSGAATDEQIASAVDQLIADGICSYFGHGIPFEKEKMITDKGTDKHAVWKVKMGINDGGDKEWYVILKATAA